uniref:Translation elongation factor EFTu/EF1A C-terminal domain-containing protein n=1 Tax=Xiphophorus couchianus TaxID=32473 RepID=A0A3B5MLC9_9TELE
VSSQHLTRLVFSYTATILSMNRDCLRTGDKASVHFRFIKTPEYLHCDQRLVFREGRTKAVGTITKVERLHGH